ncbi:MAG: S-layer homology domain-containing protein, partial [Clostridia bacterium]|nr:S-layer homology domain-containing protein [Clostridia bacterium]
FDQPAPFADDADISDWARNSVYFMAANGIILGDNNIFSPRAVTGEQQAAGYANATREQALLIAVRMVEKLGG